MSQSNEHNENIESLNKNVEEYERNARRRAWLSAGIPLLFGVLLLGYTIWQIQLYSQKLETVQAQLGETTEDLGLAINDLNTTQEELEQADVDLTEIRDQLNTTTAELESARSELGRLNEELEQTRQELQKRSDFLAYSITIDRFGIKELIIDYPYVTQGDLLNFVLVLQERRIPYSATGFSEGRGFNSPNFTVYVMQQCGLINRNYGADSGPQSMLRVINVDELSIGDIVADEAGSGYSMFYFEFSNGEPFLIGMTPAGILAVTTDFILTPKYYDVPFEELFDASQCQADF